MKITLIVKVHPVPQFTWISTVVNRVPGSALLESVHIKAVSGSPALFCSGFSQPCWMSNMAYSLFCFFLFRGVLGVEG